MRPAKSAPLPPVSWSDRLARPWVGFALLALLAALAYANSFGVPFVFDDEASIPGNPTIRGLTAGWWSPPGGGLTVSGRPLLNLTFALNHALSGLAPWSYHAANWLIHVLAGGVLLALLRRTFRQPVLAARGGADGPWLALTIAVLWTVHPLQTESVTYIVQRAESLAGLFYLLTLLCGVRALDRPEATGWRWAAVGACVAGLLTKESVATVPVLLALYDRSLATGSWRETWRRGRRLFPWLAATWLVPAYLIWSGGDRGGTVGFGVGVAWWAYGATQFEAITRYLALSVWPQPLVFEYGTFWVKSWREIGPGLAVVAGALAATGWAWWRRPAAGLAGASVFILLAPTSLTPGTIQMIVEHRMYLPLAAVLALVVAGVGWLAGRRGLWVALALGVPAGVALTWARNADYATPVRLFEDTVAKRPQNARARALLADYYRREGRLEEARTQLERSLAIQADVPEVWNNLGLVQQQLGATEAAVASFRKSAALRPADAGTHGNLGGALLAAGQTDAGLAELAVAVRFAPQSRSVRMNFASALAQLQRWTEAEAAFVETVRLAPDDAEVRARHGQVLQSLGRRAEAVAELQAAVRLAPENADYHNQLGTALGRGGRLREALREFEEALRLDPAHPSAARNAQLARQRLGGG